MAFSSFARILGDGSPIHRLWVFVVVVVVVVVVFIVEISLCALGRWRTRRSKILYFSSFLVTSLANSEKKEFLCFPVQSVRLL